MIMASLLSWNVSEKLSEGLLGPPSCKIAAFLFVSHQNSCFLLFLSSLNQRAILHSMCNGECTHISDAS